MNKWVLLEHKVYSAYSLDIHYDFLVENGKDCLTWKGDYVEIEILGLYWHFVDLVWVFVFTFFYLV